MIPKKSYYSTRNNEPTISVGIICIMLDSSIIDNTIGNIINELNINESIDSYNYKRLYNLSKINFYKDKIKFLLIERKHSLNYIEFIRGLYKIDDNDKLIKMFSLMSKTEHNMIRNNNFTKLWNNLWGKTARKAIYMKEFKESKNKFETLQKNKTIEMLLTRDTIYSTPEWEIPKGRKNNGETNIECAKREFYEETGYNENDYIIMNSLYNISDDFIGTNGKKYKHIYYLSIFTGNINNKTHKNNEVNDVKFLSWLDTVEKIRPYCESKIKIINDIFLYFINMIEDVKSNVAV